MSLLEPESDSADMEENPNPEEDSGLPQRHQLNGEGLDVRGEEDYAEEDLVMAQETVDTTQNMLLDGEESIELVKGSPDIEDNSEQKDVEGDSRDIVSCEELSGLLSEGDSRDIVSCEELSGLLSEGDSRDIVSCEELSGLCEGDSRDIVSCEELSGLLSEGDSRDIVSCEELSGLCEDDQEQNLSSTTVGDLNFFEEDETTCATEDVNGVSHEFCSKNDRQLFISQEIIPSQYSNYSLPVVNGECELQAVKAESELPNVFSKLTDVHRSTDIATQDNFESSCAVPGIVGHASNLSDISEGVNLKCDRRTSSCEEKDDLSLHVGHDISAESENLHHTSSPCLGEQPDQADLDDTNAEHFSSNQSGVLVGREGVVNNLQAAECGNQGVLLNESLNDRCPKVQAVAAPELTSPVQDSHNNLPDYPLLTAEQDPISHDCTELSSDYQTRDSHLEDLAAAISSCKDTHNTPVSAFQKMTNSCEDDVSGAQDDSRHYNPSHVDAFSTESTDNSPIHQHNLLHAENSNHVLLSQVVSQEKQQQTAHPISDSSSLHTSIPTQEICKILHSEVTHKIEDGLFLSSASQSPPTVEILHVNDEHGSSDSNVNNHTQAKESVSQECFTSSLPSPTESSNIFISSDAEPHSSHIRSQIQILESASDDSSPSSSQQSSPAKTLSSTPTPPGTFSHSGKEQTAAFQNNNEHEIFQDLHALLLAYTSGSKPLHSSVTGKECGGPQGNKNIGQTVNGQQPLFNFGQIQDYNRQLLEQMKIRDDEIAKLTSELNSVREAPAQHLGEEQMMVSSHQADDLYLPQIKVLEHTIAQQQKEIQALKLKLASQDGSAKKAITSLQNELKSRVGQVTKMYEDSKKEKDVIVVMFAESEAKNMEAKRIVEKSEAKVKEVMKDKEMMTNTLKAAKAEKQKAISNFETKCIEITGLQKEIEKLKEALTSCDNRTKWFQNKLSVEVEDHKETKGNLEKTTIKLKEAREETEIIRKECHAIVKRYQESEEIKSNSLDKELKLKETELRTQLQERDDNEEIHQMLKRELDSLKGQHKDTIEEAKTYKDKVQCLEEERRQNHQMIENYQEIMQRQKTSNAELNIRITSLSSLEDEYKGSKEMLQTLQTEVSYLRDTNEELQRDMDSCSERESKMLALQSELSHANAVLRSENTSLNNKISYLTSDLEKCKKEVHTFEAAIKDLRDRCDKEKAKGKEEGEKMASILAERTKECNDVKQKWEDEMDTTKTLKRRHTSNIKDLTRQLHQVHKRLESIEGKGDCGSMGSRTNSNGSLNSLENTARPMGHPPVQEFPVITEQVEVDKQVLIERIVRLQKSLARKNEKLEFLGEHIQQLLEDIKKKNKVIQCYALREESGTLSSESMDANKAKVQKEMQTLLARKGGIMASLYSAQQQDGSMTLDLSLQISRKLQAVLEDTLLKNITLKESLDTLGEEIARLSQENRKLQLHLQKIEGNLA